MATCVEPGGFQDVVMANLLGSGDLQVTVSGRIDPFPPMGPQPATYTSEALDASICMVASVS